MKITNNSVVNAIYELYVDGENGELELMEKATADRPLNFIFGVGMMLPAFEKNIEGLQAGDTFKFTLTNEEAYGEYDDEAVIELERSVFEIDGKMDEEVVFEGNVVPLMDSEGNRLQAQVVTVNDTHVTVDLNHPLAGETLHFNGKVLDTREATADEINSLFGGGCGCGDCGCSDDEHNHCHDDSCGCSCN